MSDVYALVRSIRARRLPRNRHFDAHDTRQAAEARRWARLFRALERDLAAASSVELLKSEAGYELKLAFPTVRLSRSVFLTDEELALLSDDPALGNKLPRR